MSPEEETQSSTGESPENLPCLMRRPPKEQGGLIRQELSSEQLTNSWHSGRSWSMRSRRLSGQNRPRRPSSGTTGDQPSSPDITYDPVRHAELERMFQTVQMTTEQLREIGDLREAIGRSRHIHIPPDSIPDISEQSRNTEST